MRLITLFLLIVATYGANAQCGTPTDLSTSPITARTGTARWAAVSGAISYDVEYKLASSSDWLIYIYGVTGLQCLITAGVEPTTTYDWRVRANCASGSSSFAQSQFTTGALGSCIPPDGLSLISTTATTATVIWNPATAAVGYTVEYKATLSSTWIVAGNINLTTVTIFSLSPGTTYDWRVKSNCSLYEGSNYNTSQFTMPGSTSTCPGAYDLTSNGTTGGAAMIPLNIDIKGAVSAKNDIDHYKFIISSGGTITVALTALPANYDLAVLNGSGTQIAASQNKSTKSESISLNVAAGTYYAKVSPVGTANNASSCYNLKVQTGTAARTMAVSTDENGIKPEFAFNLYPNPAGDQLNVWTEGVDKSADIKVYNLMGKLVMQRQSNTMLTQLNISKFPAGIYLLNVNNGKETKAVKFVKQ